MLALFAADAAQSQEMDTEKANKLFELLQTKANQPLWMGLDVAFLVLTLVWVVCFLWVLIAMFKNGSTGWGIITILATLLCGVLVGPVIAFFGGWMKSDDWGVKKVMTAWTLSILLWLGLFGYLGYQVYGMYQEAAEIVQKEQDKKEQDKKEKDKKEKETKGMDDISEDKKK
jgi:uncharacterized membrane-anchored protein